MNTTLLLIACAAAGINVVLWALHYAVRDISLPRLKELAEGSGSRGTRRLIPIVNDPDGHALSVGIFGLISSVALVVCVVVMLPISHIEEGQITLVPPMLLLGGGIGALALYLTSMLLPLSIADWAGEKLIYTSASLVRLLYYIAWPLRTLWAVDVVVKRLAGEGETTEEDEAHEEILSAVSEGEQSGHISEAERKMIEAVVDFRSTTTEAIMTPRTEVEGIDLTDDLPSIIRFIEEAGHSRIPVFEHSPDEIAGILYAKDLLPFVGKDAEDFKLRSILREALFVPESKLVNDLLIELQTRKVHMAIVLDEYGGTTGLVTFEDILEEIVGEIEDEYEPEHETLPEICVDETGHTAEIDARAYLNDANEALEPIEIKLPEGEDYDTVGGYILAKLGHIPVAGEDFHENGYLITILDAEPTRVTRLRVEKREQTAEESATSESV
jgi:CBS domain containing-hemolysin-like protein